MKENNRVRLGVLGLSPGNGHPYSWSAICNGYNKKAMENCGFPAIPRYLEKQSFPADLIYNAEVTHVWSQDRDISNHIALASNIKYVVDDFRDMIGIVDGVLLARDDAEMHLYYAKPFLEAGVPLYVDKPLALSVEGAKNLINLQKYPGQLFSCSSLRYAKEFSISNVQYESLGRIKCIMGATPKDWDRYSIHVIEPMLRLFPELTRYPGVESRWASNDRVVLRGKCQTGLEYEVSTMGKRSIPISLKIVGEDDCIDMIFLDTFSAFKAALQAFIDSTCKKIIALSVDEMLASISFVEAGRA